jgi:Rne/Rng family ribonuclease
MSKELFVSSTPHETKVAIVEEDQLTEVYFERENEYTLAGSIYKGRVTRVLPGMQSAFVNIGLERDAFLYVSDFLLDEEEDAEALEQLVPRPYVFVSESEPRSEAAQEPIEAEQIAPHVGEEADTEPHDGADVAGPGGETQDPDREGARRWKGRRRRGRGRDRFQEREGDRGSDRPHERGEHEARPVEPVHESRPVEPVREAHPVDAVREQRPQPPSSYQAMILPGESISKYQPHTAAKPAASQPRTPVQPSSQSGSRPSTEYSFNPSQFSPDSMVLPGESLAKYQRGGAPKEAVRVAEEVRHVQQIEAAEPVSTATPVEAVSAVEHETVVQEAVVPRIVEEEIHTGQRHDNVVSVDAATTSAEMEPHSHEEAPGSDDYKGQFAPEQKEEQRSENMNVASVFGGAGAGHPQETIEEYPEANAPRELTHASDVQASHPWSAAGSGVVEEEEIEEEESELPGFEEQLDLDDFEELEEEELGQFDEQLVPLGSELTEAVRDAHTEGRATGQYEAEGLEAAEEFEEMAETFGQTEETEEEDELDASEQAEELDSASAEMRAPAPTAGYQQRVERKGDRRGGGRKPARRMRGRPRHQAQRTFPAISDLLKEGQEILVQIAKEPIAKKGARITSHIALPGRFLVYMPTVHHTGVSRKIASEEDRQRLKRIVMSERGEAHGGFIVRTAAAGASEDDLRADIRFLINLWNEIRGRAEKSKAPALIYHDLNLVERVLRDQVTTSFSAIWVDSEQEYERILRFVSRFQSSLLKRVKLYSKETPLFEQFNISDEINKALKSKVWLKSGGYIVINQTEALVAIDINTGKYVGKTARLEDTIVKTNIDAIKEIVRQIRLRDLGGIIVIDFIDMDERKNRQRVMQALEEALRADRAPSKVLQFNDFGLVAITRKRVKQSLERTLGQQCPTCTGTGMIKSVGTVCNEIYVEMRKMARHFEHDVVLRVNPEVAKLLKSAGTHWVEEMEELTKRTIVVKSDPLLHPEQFDIQ